MGLQQCWWEEPLIQLPPQNRVITNTKSAWPWLCLVRAWKPSRLSTVPLDDHASVSQRSFPDLQFGSPKLLLPLVTSFAFTEKSLALSFLQAAVGSHELTPPPTQTAQGTPARKGNPKPQKWRASQAPEISLPCSFWDQPALVAEVQVLVCTSQNTSQSLQPSQAKLHRTILRGAQSSPTHILQQQCWGTHAKQAEKRNHSVIICPVVWKLWLGQALKQLQPQWLSRCPPFGAFQLFLKSSQSPAWLKPTLST